MLSSIGLAVRVSLWCDSKWTKLFYQSFATVNVAIITSGLFAGVAFIIKFGSINIEETLYVIFAIFGNLLIENMIIVGFILQSTIIDTFQLLSDICELSKKTEIIFICTFESVNV